MAGLCYTCNLHFQGDLHGAPELGGLVQGPCMCGGVATCCAGAAQGLLTTAAAHPTKQL